MGILFYPWPLGANRRARLLDDSRLPPRLRAKEVTRNYSDGFEVIERDKRGRMVVHVVVRTGHPYVNERYEYRNGERIVVERDGIPTESGEKPHKEAENG